VPLEGVTGVVQGVVPIKKQLWNVGRPNVFEVFFFLGCRNGLVLRYQCRDIKYIPSVDVGSQSSMTTAPTHSSNTVTYSFMS
jgi:hypothetical protein